MTLTVKERAETIATFRHIEVRLMETLARWIPTTPETEVKVLFGRHVWDVAQHADALGKRTYELRAPMHFTQKPTDDYVAFLDALERANGGPDRIHALYDIALPALAARYEAFVARTDALLDAPSVKVVRRILGDMEAMRAEANALRSELPALARNSDLTSLRSAESKVAHFVVHRTRTPQEASA